MTVIGSLRAGPFVQQGSDRLVTAGRRVHDPAANKTVLFVASDGVAAVSYTGAAYVGDVPTDQFVAETIARRSFGSDPPPLSATLGRVERLPSMGEVAIRLAEALQKGKWSPVEIPHRPDLAILGWKWRDRRGRRTDRGTFLWNIHAHGGPYSVSRTARPRPGTVRVSFMPRGRAVRSEVDAYLDALQATPVGDEPLASEHLAALVRTIADRSAAAGDPTVGREVMIVTIPPPHRNRLITVRFVADPDASPVSAHGSYSPWIIGPSTTIAPAEMSTGWNVPMEPFRVQLVGPTGPPGFRSIKREARRSSRT